MPSEDPQVRLQISGWPVLVLWYLHVEGCERPVRNAKKSFSNFPLCGFRVVCVYVCARARVRVRVRVCYWPGGCVFLSRSLKSDNIKRISYQIIRAVEFCHQNRIVHRDVKPENILISTKEQQLIVKLCDFGFARTVGVHLWTMLTGRHVSASSYR